MRNALQTPKSRGRQRCSLMSEITQPFSLQRAFPQPASLRQVSPQPAWHQVEQEAEPRHHRTIPSRILPYPEPRGHRGPLCRAPFRLRRSSAWAYPGSQQKTKPTPRPTRSTPIASKSSSTTPFSNNFQVLPASRRATRSCVIGFARHPSQAKHRAIRDHRRTDFNRGASNKSDGLQISP